MQLRIVAIIIKFFTIQFAAAQQLGPDATANIQDHVGGAPDITTLPIVTVTAPAITPRPTRKFSSPLPPCVLECLQKAVDSSGCGKKAVDSQNCACVNPVYQVTSRSCIKETCSDSDQELASHIQQKCSENKEIRPAFHPPTAVSPIVSLTTNMMAVMTDQARNEAHLNKGNVEMELAMGAGILGLVFAL